MSKKTRSIVGAGRMPVAREAVAPRFSRPIGDEPGGAATAPAVLTFLPDWRQHRQGDLVPGGILSLQYDPARLAQHGQSAAEAWSTETAVTERPRPDILAFARFLPGGELHTATLLSPSAESSGGNGIPPVAASGEIAIPPDATRMELWFRNASVTGDSAWDSRFGQNYRYDVASPTGAAPAQSVSPRAGAIADPETVRVTADAGVKRNVFPSRPGYPSGMTNLQIRLHVEAWVRNATYEKSIWIDAHVFDRDEVLVHAETLRLEYARPAGDGGDLFALDGMLFQGSVATQGSVEPRQDVRTLQYRLYCELDGRLFTDALLHRCELRADSVSG